MTEAASPSGGLPWRRAAGVGLSFRPATDGDLPFLLRVYSSTREDELAQVAWDPAQKADFLAMQFHAQHTYYRQHYAGALWLVILHGGAPIGRLYLERTAGTHCIIDIALLPEFRGRGLGSALMRDLIEEAAAAGKPLSIHVEKNNPAYRLYTRLGFTAVGEFGLYDRLELRPAAAQVNTA